MIKFVDLKAQYDSIRGEINEAVQQVLDSTHFVLGENVAEFEKEFAAYCKAKHSVGLNTGTSALHLALIANGIGFGDEVITTPNTYFATCEAISYTGAMPRFVDIDEDTFNMDPNKIEKSITKKTKAIIPVDLCGQPADMSHIMEIGKKRGLTVIEDACQAHGAEHYGKRVPIADVGCFSFYPGKNLGAYGEGGQLVTNDNEVDRITRAYRDHGQTKKHFHKYIGYNYRLEELQAAILRVKLKHLDKWIEMRRRNAAIYNEKLKEIEVVCPAERNYNRHVYHLYIIRVKNRQKLIKHLNSRGIQTGIHYPVPIHLQEAYKSLGNKIGSFPVAEKFSDEILSLPMFPELKEEEISCVAQSIKEFLRK